MKQIIFIFLFAIFDQISSGQDGLCLMSEFDNTEIFPLVPSSGCEPSSDYNSYLNDVNSYIPTSNSNNIVVRINFHIVQKANGTGNWNENSPEHMQILYNIFNQLNYYYSDIREPLWGGQTGDSYLSDSKIRFRLTGIYFHKSDAVWAHSTNKTRTAEAFRQFQVDADSVLNVFFLRDPDLEAIGSNNTSLNGLGFGLIYPKESFAAIFDTYQDYIKYGVFRWSIVYPLVVHEIGHCLSLEHTRGNDGFTDTYNPENSSWGCNPSSDHQCSNNFMTSYSQIREYLSPSQIGKLHLYLQTTWRSKWVDNNLTSGQNTIINSYNLWDRTRALNGNIIINTGGLLELECKLYMPEGSDITINSGGKLKILSGQITHNRNKLLSNIIINDGGYLELANTSIGNIRVVNNSGGSVSFNEEIDITNIGQVFCKANSYVCLNTNIDLNLKNFYNCINFYGNVNIGLNPIINENSGICSLDLTNILSTGQGTINLIEDDVFFIQNTQFLAPEYIPASIIKIGTNVNPNAASGPVILYNGSHIYLNSSNEVTIQGDFEIQPGAEFTLEMR